MKNEQVTHVMQKPTKENIWHKSHPDDFEKIATGNILSKLRLLTKHTTNKQYI